MPVDSLKNESTSRNTSNPYNFAKAKQWAFKGAKYGTIGGVGIGLGFGIAGSALIAITATLMGCATGNGDKPLEGRLFDTEMLKCPLYGAGYGAAIGASFGFFAAGAGRFGYNATHVARTQLPNFFRSKRIRSSVEEPIPPKEEINAIKSK